MDSTDGTERASTGGMEGQTVAGKYQLVRLLGAGGMGAVYEGRNLATLKRCAIKLLLSPELGRNEQIVRRFFREAKASSVIESDHVVQIFDSGSDPQTGYPYMVMEMLSGEDLEGTLKRLQCLDPLVSAKLVLQATMGLARAHEAGIIHRDIKPANLFLTSRDSGDLVVKILDFGIAKVVMEQFSETSHGLTRTGSMLGTPLYMSPEQAKGSKTIDARSDVWSLGVVMYELLSGSLPFADASSLGELMVSIITADIPLLQDRAPWVPPELAEIAHRAMSRNIDMRFQHAGDFRDALAALVPDGPRITPDLLQPISDQHRAFVAPRLQLTDDGMLRATTRAGLSATTALVTPPKKSAAPAIVASAIGLAVLGIGGATTWKLTRSPPPAPAAAAPPPVILSADMSDAVSPTPVIRTFKLGVAPDNVNVTIDGEAREVKDHHVELSGSPGATRKVKLVLGKDSTEQTVAITETGLLPPTLEIETKKAGVGAAPRVASKGKPAATAKPAAAPTAKPPSKKTPQIAKDLGEFGN